MSQKILVGRDQREGWICVEHGSVIDSTFRQTRSMSIQQWLSRFTIPTMDIWEKARKKGEVSCEKVRLQQAGEW